MQFSLETIVRLTLPFSFAFILHTNANLALLTAFVGKKLLYFQDYHPYVAKIGCKYTQKDVKSP